MQFFFQVSSSPDLLCAVKRHPAGQEIVEEKETETQLTSTSLVTGRRGETRQVRRGSSDTVVPVGER